MTPEIEERNFKSLFNNFHQNGKVIWIGLRNNDDKNIECPSEVMAEIGGLVNDKANKGYATSKRQVTLIQAEHIENVASFMGIEKIDPTLLRRNIVIKGINLNALKNQKISIGEAILEMTGNCYPCSKMEKNLGKGGFNAMRGHGGITTKVLKAGIIKIGDEVSILTEQLDLFQSS